MLRNTILSSLAHPDHAWIVLLVGIIMIYREFVRPGRVLPGVFGGVAACVAIYSLFRHPIHADAAGMVLGAAALVVVQGLRRWYWLPSVAAAVLMTMGAQRLTEPPISALPAAASIPLCLVSGFLLHTALAARRRKRSLETPQ
jgi:membrane-bound serine protease (ClpP class)